MPKVQKMDSDSLSSNIYRRLINFILRTLRRPSALLCSTQVPVEEGKPINRPNGFVDSEIAVEFKHTDGSERWSQTNEHGGSILAPMEDGLIVGNDQTKLQNGLDRKGLQEMEALPGRDGRGKGLKKTVTIKGSEKKKEGNQSASDQATMANNQPHDETKPRPPRHHWPLLSVASNINEKSDAYIKRIKKAMGRNYSLDPETS